MSKKHLIIGCGAAGLAALEKIRQINSEDEVKLVTGEIHLPYSPTALPYVFAGRVPEAGMWTRDESHFARMKSTLARGKELVKVLPDAKEVLYADGSKEAYDNLLIATGSEPVVPRIPGLQDAGFMVFRSLDDCRRLAQAQRNGASIAVVGGGLVGMEIAACLMEKGCKVHVVETEPRLLPRHFAGRFSDVIESIFRRHGAEIYTSHTVRTLRRQNNKVVLYLSPQSSIEADLVIVAAGMKPRTSFLFGTGVEVRNGVVVDRTMRTTVDGVFAAGDVAEAPDFFFGRPGQNPILPSAVAQGKIAGANMAGKSETYQGWISRIIFNFFDHTAFCAGLALESGGDYQVLTANAVGSSTQMVFQGNRLVGVSTLDKAVDPGVFVYLMRNRVDIDGHKDALLERPQEISRWLMLKAEKEGNRPVEAR